MATKVEDTILQELIEIVRSEIKQVFPDRNIREVNHGSESLEIEVSKSGSMGFYISVGTPEVGEVVFFAEGDSNLTHDWLPRYSSVDQFKGQLHWLLENIKLGQLAVEKHTIAGKPIGTSKFVMSNGDPVPAWLRSSRSILNLAYKKELVTFRPY
jgi:hypothetical protein